MPVTRRDALRRTAALAAATLLPSLAQGQAPAGYPNRAIRFIVPYAPGGFPDTVARILAQRLSDRLGQSVVIDNRPGANGGVAAGVLTSAPADGYQFLVTDGSMFSINPLIYSKLTYDPKKDFVPVALVSRAPLFMALHPKVPANNLKEFLDYVEVAAWQGELRIVGHRQHASPDGRGDEGRRSASTWCTSRSRVPDNRCRHSSAARSRCCSPRIRRSSASSRMGA